LIVNGGIVVVVVGGTVVVVGDWVVEVVVVSREVVACSASGEQEVAMTARTSKTERRRYMVDLEMVVRPPSRDRPGTLTV
jgi:hypothetical protein